jgi:hypothetical protein
MICFCCSVQALLEEWIATRAFRDNCIPQVSMEALVLIQSTNLHFFENGCATLIILVIDIK